MFVEYQYPLRVCKLKSAREAAPVSVLSPGKVALLFMAIPAINKASFL
jgi:hypothetical protein